MAHGFHVKTRILAGVRICISVPLRTQFLKNICKRLLLKLCTVYYWWKIIKVQKGTLNKLSLESFNSLINSFRLWFFNVLFLSFFHVQNLSLSLLIFIFLRSFPRDKSTMKTLLLCHIQRDAMIFFFYLDFLPRTFTIHKTTRERGGYL